jgi:uncharacterized protein
MDKIHTIIERTTEEILKECSGEIDAILLFGSHANGSAIWRSDIDICVIFKKDVNLQEATKFRIGIAGKVSDKVDIQVFNILPLKLKKSIADNHKILFQHDDFNEFNFVKRNRSLFFELQNRLATL